ncbi:uncharacterized protein LOC129975579 [Argiope bruennichi]|uniref:uncharacterized protein LOC129975579 n=1 Tax=Argiope bruennichi TaxID=94029 RepID=UPI0024955586|nr:uncharacterized protein LOC129975579 [Argiope bruennichi]
MFTILPHMNNDLKGKFVEMVDTSMFVRNGLHSPIVTEETAHEMPKKEDEASSAWKILKIILFVICLIVFIHQSVGFFNLYYTYSTTTSTIMTHPDVFKMPAVTFCSDNPVRRSSFCANYSFLCEDATETGSCGSFDSKIPNFGYCTKERGENALDGAFRERLCSRENYRNNFSSLCETHFGSLAWSISNNKNESELTPTFVEDPERKTFVTCLSSYLHLDDRFEVDTWPTDSQMQNEVIDYKITVHKNESFYPWTHPQIFLSIHSSLVPVNPLLEGIPLKTGHSYSIYIRLEEEHLLASPYGTNCTDYDELWRKNNMTGPRSREMCRDMCMWFSATNSTIKMVLPKYSSEAFTEMYKRWNSTDECMENCSTDCTITTPFTTTTDGSLRLPVFYSHREAARAGSGPIKRISVPNGLIAKTLKVSSNNYFVAKVSKFVAKLWYY